MGYVTALLDEAIEKKRKEQEEFRLHVTEKILTALDVAGHHKRAEINPGATARHYRQVPENPERDFEPQRAPSGGVSVVEAYGKRS